MVQLVRKYGPAKWSVIARSLPGSNVEKVSKTYSSMANLWNRVTSSSGKFNPVLASTSHEASPISEDQENKYAHGVSEIIVWNRFRRSAKNS